MEEINSVEDFAKLKLIMDQSSHKFGKQYCIELILKDGDFWIRLSDEWDAGYACAEGSLNDILNYLLDVG